MHISDLGNLLASSDSASRRKAAELLSQNADAAGEVAIDLVQHVADDDRVVAEYCVATLEELGPPPASQLQSLAKLVSDNRADVAYWAATLVGRCGVASAEHAKQLGDVVASDAPPQVRERAAWAIGRIGPAAVVAAPQLQACTTAEPSSLARAVAKALELIEA